MAFDEWLLNRAIDRNLCSARVYLWEQPTLSLGYFQKPDELQHHPDWQGLPMVKRLTGGGAILHHHELTYAIAVPKSHPDIRPNTQIYRQIHKQIIDTLSAHGVESQLRGTARSARSEPMLCFGRADTNDIVIGEAKIVGSAQRRRKGAVLQHGSVLLARSEFASAHPGITDLIDSQLDTTALHAELLKRIGETLASATNNTSLSLSEMSEIEQLSEFYRVC